MAEEWLNGWGRMMPGENGPGSTVLLGTMVRCVGCGLPHGLACVVFPDGWEPPGPEPVWPFERDSCPICWFHQHWEPRREAEPWPRGKRRPLP
jgi:hypothetical protein